MKNKGFTLVELLAVIVILGIVMVIATSSVGKSLEESRKRTRFIAAKEITEIAAAYMESETNETCVSVENLIGDEYLESDVTNPKTGENGGDFSRQEICENERSYEQTNYEVQDGNFYKFDGYVYYLEIETTDGSSTEESDEIESDESEIENPDDEDM